MPISVPLSQPVAYTTGALTAIRNALTGRYELATH
jgi:hypothetical protein